MIEWKRVAEFPDYHVSSAGYVMGPRGGILKSQLTAAGYLIVGLHYGEKGRRRQISKAIHVIVATAFHGARPHGHCVAHNDGVRTNNAASNLRWATPAENQADRARHGTRVHGTMVHTCKLSKADIEVIRSAVGLRGLGVRLARQFNVSPQLICEIRANKVWRSP